MWFVFCLNFGEIDWVTYCNQVMPYLVNVGSGNGLLPDSTKPLPETVLTYHQ